MNKPYEIVHSVHDAYRGLAVKLSRMTNKAEQWWRSHGYERRTDNPIANGNKCAVDDFMAYCETYEAAERGAGRMLASRTYLELDARFTEHDLSTTQRELHLAVIDEGCDVQKLLTKYDIPNANKNECLLIEKECAEAVEAFQDVMAQARARRRILEISRSATNGSRY